MDVKPWVHELGFIKGTTAPWVMDRPQYNPGRMDNPFGLFMQRELAPGYGAFRPYGRENIIHECDNVDRRQLSRWIQNHEHTIGNGTALLFENGHMLHQDTNNAESISTLKVGTRICMISVIYQNLSRSFVGDEPIIGYGPDSLHYAVNSPDIQLPLLLPLPLPYPPTINDYAFYASEFTLMHPGTYTVKGEIEWSAWNWVMIKGTMRGLGNTTCQYLMSDIPIQILPNTIAIHGVPVDRPSRFCSSQDQTRIHGRWYRASAFNSQGSQTIMNSKAELPFANVPSLQDDFGFVFAPDNCELEYYSLDKNYECVAGKTINVLGDSNCRRLAKTLIAGENWCPDPSWMCSCIDSFEQVLVGKDMMEVNISMWSNATKASIPTHYGNTTLYVDFVGGVVSSFYPWTEFLEGNFLRTHDVPIDVERMKNGVQFDVVMISMVGWDAAYNTDPKFIEGPLITFRDTVLNTFPSTTKFIIRLANSNCCGDESFINRYSLPRFEMFNSIWRRVFESVDQERIIWLNSAVLQNREDLERTYPCETTHMRPQVVRTEAQILLNLMCHDKFHSSD